MADDASSCPAGDEATIRPLTRTEQQFVPALWNAAWTAATRHEGDPHGVDRNPYPLTQALWQERLTSRHHDPALLLGAFDGDRLVGVAYAKASVAHWQTPSMGWLALLCVAPDRQGGGIGTRLARVVVDLLRERGCVHLRIGGEADHLLPGLPQEAGAAAWRLARALGGVPSNAEHDLLLDLRVDLPPAPLPAGFDVRDDRGDAALAFVERQFPGRWAEEVAGYLAAGATTITLERTEAPGTAPALGFCVVFAGGERATSPGLLWSRALRAELGAQTVRLGGIGPLGVAQDVRGAGAGLALVRAAATWLAERGTTHAVINWTTLTSFYGRLGARVWRTYQRIDVSPPRQSDDANAGRESQP